MKLLIILILSFITYCSYATNYYVSNTGNDGNDGTTAGKAWKTLAKVNSAMAAMSSGDSILFEKGSAFYGSLIFSRTGINIGSYGTGARPVITGSTTVTGWADMGGGVYRAALATKYNLNLVTVDGQLMTIARYPNGDSYIAFTKVTDTSKIIMPGASAIRTNILNKTIAIRHKLWSVQRDSITAVSAIGDTVTYVRGNMALSANAARLEAVSTGYGAFYMGSITFLDTYGEWVYTGGYLYMYFGATNPNSVEVKAATVETLVNIGIKNNISIRDIELNYSNLHAIYLLSNSNTKITNCGITYSGAEGIHVFQSNMLTIDSVDCSNILSTAICNESGFPVNHNATVRRCNITDVGRLQGMGSFNQPNTSSYTAINNGIGDTCLVELNYIRRTGKSGITFGGDNAQIRYNDIDSCGLMYKDNGLIYTYADGTPTFVNREIHHNILGSGVGNNNGTTSTTYGTVRIYMDGVTMNVDVHDNTLYGEGLNGIHSNNGTNINVHDNLIVFDSSTAAAGSRGISWFKWAGDTIINFTVQNNTIVSFMPATQMALKYTVSNLYGRPLAEILPLSVTMDGNSYTNTDYGIFKAEAGSITSYTLAQWRTNFGLDMGSVKLTAYPKYQTLLVYNATPYTVSKSLPGGKSYVDYSGGNYSGSVSLGAYESKFLILTGSTPAPPLPAAAVRLPFRTY